MRPVEQLIDTANSAWPEVQKAISDSKGRARVVPGERARGERALYALQVTTRSPMGAIALETGGIIVDHGWIRILGGGSDKLASIASWNNLTGDATTKVSHLVVAYDVVGGLFAVNGGDLPGKPGNVAYFAPDSLEWEDTEHDYTGILEWALSGDLELFYKTERWEGWVKDVETLSDDQGISIWPPLWTRESRTSTQSRKAVPIKELVGLEMDMRNQLEKH
jgi:uncharacterized protein DUF2625